MAFTLSIRPLIELCISDLKTRLFLTNYVGNQYVYFASKYCLHEHRYVWFLSDIKVIAIMTVCRNTGEISWKGLSKEKTVVKTQNNNGKTIWFSEQCAEVQYTVELLCIEH